MTHNQIQYWDLMRQKAADAATKSHYEQQDSASLKNAEANARNAESNAINAGANVRNAATNERNAATNEKQLRLDISKLAETIRHNQQQELVDSEHALAHTRDSYTNETNARTSQLRLQLDNALGAGKYYQDWYKIGLSNGSIGGMLSNQMSRLFN